MERGDSLASSVRQLVLLNGDRLVVTTVGGRQTMALRSATTRDALTSLRLGGQMLEIPTVAVPYLGRGMSPSLFELNALEKAESGGRLPVQVALTGRRPAIPGVTAVERAVAHLKTWRILSEEGGRFRPPLAQIREHPDGHCRAILLQQLLRGL